METKVVPAHPDEAVMFRIRRRDLTLAAWVDDPTHFASGTLVKSKQLGMTWRTLALEERTAWEWGWEFKLVPRSRVAFGDAPVEGDCPSVTETIWHSHRYHHQNPFPLTDRFEVKYLTIAQEGASEVRGLGLILRETSAQWVPAGYIVCCVIAQYEDRSRFDLVMDYLHGKLFGPIGWKPPRNPF